MIEINKPVHRITPDAYRVLYSHPEKIVVTVKHDVIAFRHKGRRASFTIPIEAAFKIAVRNEANRIVAEKRAAKKERAK